MRNFTPMNANEALAKALDVLISSQTGPIYKQIETAVAKGELSTEWKLPEQLRCTANSDDRLQAVVTALKAKDYQVSLTTQCYGSCDYGCGCKTPTHLLISW